MNEKPLSENNAKHAWEMLKLINDANQEDQVRLLKKWGDKSPLDMLLSLNFNERVKLDLPEGMPPYKRDEETHPDMMMSLVTQIKRLKACVTTNKIKRMDKERVFIQVIEMIPPKDADVLCACKDRELTIEFPNITKELVKSVFPNYVS